MKYKINNSINRSIKNLIDDTINGNIDIPDNSVILHLSQDMVTNIITKKRLEIVDTIKKKKPGSVMELANILKRKVQAVDRDIKLLENYGIVSLKREGQAVVPSVEKEVVIISLIKPKTLEKVRDERVIKLKEEMSKLTDEERKHFFKEIAKEHLIEA